MDDVYCSAVINDGRRPFQEHHAADLGPGQVQSPGQLRMFVGQERKRKVEAVPMQDAGSRVEKLRHLPHTASGKRETDTPRWQVGKLL
jgi:hypothetical protein